MNKVFTQIVGYNPTDDEITYFKKIPYEVAVDDKASDKEFFKAYNSIDTVKSMILGTTIRGRICQLSLAPYNSYIRENSTSLRHINRGRFLCTLTKYKEKHKIPLD